MAEKAALRDHPVLVSRVLLHLKVLLHWKVLLCWGFRLLHHSAPCMKY